ncbi:AAC(3) family N-acetyltransferase [Streptomyces sp. NPDC004549]|uniref:aminoglycoside N(3)-acetyltransferase n=1 Tax=Streptomyces sp. NPDC004549 TaxID=3154283 RepID=UPI0033AC411B
MDTQDNSPKLLASAPRAEHSDAAVTREDVLTGLGELNLPSGAVVIVHTSLSAFGHVEGGADTLLSALRERIGPQGTLVVPTFTSDLIKDPCQAVGADPSAEIAVQRAAVPLFHDDFPTALGALPSAVLADPQRLRSRHPWASVAAVGARAQQITEKQSLAYALGKDSPFARMYDLGGFILLLGVGHTRNTFLHYAESLLEGHRRKIRRFPYMVEGERVWLEVADVAGDRERYFPAAGSAAEREGLVRCVRIGGAECRLMAVRPFIDFARLELASLLSRAPRRER